MSKPSTRTHWARFGGLAGERDEGLLESALNRPLHLVHDRGPTLCQLPAASASGIIRNRPLPDGNRRAGFWAAALFLEANGNRFTAPEGEAVERTLALAAGAIEEAECAGGRERGCEGGETRRVP